MQLFRLNPVVHSVACYEKKLKNERLVAYDMRCLYLLSGGLTVEYGDEKPKKMAPGNFMFLPAGVPYRLKCDYAKFVFVSFDLTDRYGDTDGAIRPDAPEAFRAGDMRGEEDAGVFGQVLFIEDMSAERETFLSMCRAFVTGTDYARARVSTVLKGILLRVAEECDEDALPSRMIEQFDGYIREHATEEISNTELGAVFGYHPFYISQMLKKKKGVTLHQYILSYKLRTAADMLRYTDKSVADIASDLGFSDASYFTKSFKASFGATPKDYRKAADEERI